MYLPVYLPDSTIKVSYGSNTLGIRGFDMCLDPEDLPNLIAALQPLNLGPIYINFAYPWDDQSETFSGGGQNGMVPYLLFGKDDTPAGLKPIRGPILAGVVAAFFQQSGGNITEPFLTELLNLINKSGNMSL